MHPPGPDYFRPPATDSNAANASSCSSSSNPTGFSDGSGRYIWKLNLSRSSTDIDSVADASTTSNSACRSGNSRSGSEIPARISFARIVRQ